jgi:Hint domain
MSAQTGSPKANRTRRNIIRIGSVGLAAIARTLRPRRARAAVGAACFLKGTAIRTADGDREIEQLSRGDLLPTVIGGVSPIEWIGRYVYKRSDVSKPWVKDALPVRIARSALGPNVPRTDLYLSRAHSIFIDDVLIPAGILVNGTTIDVHGAEDREELEYFHIKLEQHDVIFAEDAPCETLVTVDENAINFAEYFRLYGTPKAELPCRPFLSYNGGRSEIRSRLRSALSPWVDRRQQLDVIRDRLEERGLVVF